MITSEIRRLATLSPMELGSAAKELQAPLEIPQGLVAIGFTLLAVLIACLGLFGLASYVAEARTKEIGVRKVLGATVPQLIVMLSREFVVLVGVAFLLAAPVAYLVMQRWLEGFAYRASFGWVLFVGAGLLVLFIALVTVSYQAWRAARTNPVNALRYE